MRAVRSPAAHGGGRLADSRHRGQRASHQEPAAEQRQHERDHAAGRGGAGKGEDVALRVGEVAADQHERAIGAGHRQFPPSVARERCPGPPVAEYRSLPRSDR